MTIAGLQRRLLIAIIMGDLIILFYLIRCFLYIYFGDLLRNQCYSVVFCVRERRRFLFGYLLIWDDLKV